MFGKKKTPPLNILILGLGGVGYYLAQRLAHEECAITVIEPDSKILSQANGQIDARLIKGSALDMSCWQEADAGKMQCLIAATNNDAVNMLSSVIADKFGIDRKIARVRRRDFGKEDSIITSEDLKIDLLINPEELAAQEVVRLIKLNSGNEIIDIAAGEIQLLAAEISAKSPFAHKKLKDIAREFNEFPFRVVAIARDIRTIIPSGDQELLPNDQVFIMAVKRDLPKLMKLTDVHLHRQQKVMILGGGLVGERVAELLEKNVKVTLIEADEDRADQLSYSLAHTEVLHGDGSNSNVLVAAGLLNVDTFIATTGENETNIMSCLLAKNLLRQKKEENPDQFEARTISLVTKEDYLVLAQTTGSNIALNKKVMAGNEILKFIRRSELLSVAHLHGFDAEVVELIASPKSPITKKPLSKLDPYYMDKLIIGAVLGEEGWRVAVGQTHIQENERVIVICPSMYLKDVRKLFMD
ncbi:Trk system potassium transporter TrkA [Desulfosediminicola ganghwensis]|uniref:Trk system potassium transporter TrkA n=1 Tax=Desulfosediminicola ganghwensis TaxID=2569540 RepID=UPI0010AD9F39|nr:Trk system potassium transporter TrkA [Desulfosediminicola ganghwensis]